MSLENDTVLTLKNRTKCHTSSRLSCNYNTHRSRCHLALSYCSLCTQSVTFHLKRLPVTPSPPRQTACWCCFHSQSSWHTRHSPSFCLTSSEHKTHWWHTCLCRAASHNSVPSLLKIGDEMRQSSAPLLQNTATVSSLLFVGRWRARDECLAR